MSLTKDDYRPRIIDQQIKRALQHFGAVSIEGPKWCGKTWTALNHANSVVYLNNVETNFNERKLAEMDVTTVLGGEQPALIDEWQEVPAIWDGVRYRCDQTPKKGQYILTGSATPVTNEVRHSGAGRIYRARMRTMSLYESGESSGTISLKDLFAGKLSGTHRVPGVKLADLAQLIVRGGWPQVIGIDETDARFVASSYIDAVLSADITKVDGIVRDVQKMTMVMRSLARNESTVASDSTILRDVETQNGEISRPTITEYLNVLERLYLIEHQPAYSVNVRSSARVGKTEKRHFIDPSLTCAILGIDSEKLIADVRFFGLLFEALVERDLSVYATANDGKLYYYRDSSGLEVDAIVELADGSYGAFEIKLGTDRIDEAAANLLKFNNLVTRKPAFLAVISGLETAVYQRPDGVFVFPITALKD